LQPEPPHPYGIIAEYSIEWQGDDHGGRFTLEEAENWLLWKESQTEKP
jgi:hypothetical protein